MLYLMRHGETDWNRKRWFQGSADIPLNGNGRALARSAAEKYANVPIDLCFSSPLARAHETAELFLAGRSVPILTDGRLKELSFGVREGTPYGEGDDDFLQRIFRAPADYTPPEGAETIRQILFRVNEVLYERILPEVWAGRNVLVVAHGFTNMTLVNCLAGRLTPEEFQVSLMDNCELIEAAFPAGRG